MKRVSILTIIGSVSWLSSIAQTPPPGGGNVGAPLDTFVAALLVLAVVFSVWKFKRSSS